MQSGELTLEPMQQQIRQHQKETLEQQASSRIAHYTQEHQSVQQPLKEFKTMQSFPASFSDVKVNPMSLPDLFKPQTNSQDQVAALQEGNLQYERHKKVEAKRATENAIQKVADIIEEKQKQGGETSAQPEQMEVDWAFGQSKQLGESHLDSLTFI